jgi:ribosome biogenesis protein UTP30
VLGKTFYKSTTKRPIPVAFQKPRLQVDGKRLKRDKGSDEVNARPPVEIATEIEKAVGAALVSLSPTTNVSVRVGYAGWKAKNLAENIEHLTNVLVERHIPKGWDNVKSVFVKGPQTLSIPIWQTEELWLGNSDVVPNDSEEAKALAEKKEKANVGKKRKATEPAKEASSKKSKAEALPESNDASLDLQIKERKARLKKQKEAARATIEV